MLKIINDLQVHQRQLLTPWELPSLLTFVHTYRRSRRKAARERAHFPAILGFVYPQCHVPLSPVWWGDGLLLC